jgi:soluble lytic murein transglycosylase
VQPQTALEIARDSGATTFAVKDLANPDINIRYGTFHLRDLLDRYGGNVVPALAAYNAGPTNVEHWGGADLEVDDIGFPETHAYVENVLDRRDEYRDNYADDLGL